MLLILALDQAANFLVPLFKAFLTLDDFFFVFLLPWIIIIGMRVVFFQFYIIIIEILGIIQVAIILEFRTILSKYGSRETILKKSSGWEAIWLIFLIFFYFWVENSLNILFAGVLICCFHEKNIVWLSTIKVFKCLNKRITNRCFVILIIRLIVWLFSFLSVALWKYFLL